MKPKKQKKKNDISTDWELNEGWGEEMIPEWNLELVEWDIQLPEWDINPSE